MEQKILDSLFSKDYLHFNENIHANLATKILSVLLDKKAEGLLNQAEYMVQATISDFLTGQLRNTEYSAATEVKAFDQKRIDIAVIHTASDSPIVFYEVKSYIKSKENKVKEKEIYQDILKLAIKKKELPECEFYMILAGRTKVLKKALVDDESLLLPHKFSDTKNRATITHDLTFFKDFGIEKTIMEQAQKMGIKKISISPSRCRNSNGMAVITWRINKV